jgi:hypothetical protein
MLVLNPAAVSFADEVWEGVIALAIDRSAAREVVGYGDAGPHATFADVPAQDVSVRVVMELTRGDVSPLAPGAMGTLWAVTGPGGSDAGRRRVSMTAVVRRVTHEVSSRKGALRTVELVAISPDGVSDPVTVTDEGGAA